MSRKPTADLREAVAGLYGAVVAPETWPAALHAFARATNSVGCLFYPKDQAQALVHLPISPDIREFIAAFVNEGWYLQDVRASRGWPQLATRGGEAILTDDDIASPEERRSSPYFQDFHRAWTLTEWAAIGFRANGGQWCMPLLRSKRQGSISGEQKREFLAAAPLLSRVIELATLFDARRAAEHLAMLHLSGGVAALLDWRGIVSGLTPSAEALFGVDLYIHERSIAARHRGSDVALQKLIAAALANPEMTGTPDSVAIARAGRRPLVARAIPLAGAFAAAFGQARVLLLFTDLDKSPPPCGETLRAAFGLTPAEARLAAEFASGDALDDAANRLGIAKETARNQLKAIFGKTNTHRQGELVALLSRL